jgi:N-acetylglutamate synthase-like GNAT family acetyltransferase
MRVREATKADTTAIGAIVNAAAVAYRGVIPQDRWHEPYMPAEELEREIADGVRFWVAEDGGEMLGVMGIQDRREVTLIRHAYVSPIAQRRGVGGVLLRHLLGIARRPVLIGTWADAKWAIDFYRKHGFRLASPMEKDILLAKYWSIPERQIETSVVLMEEGAVDKLSRIGDH